MRVVESRVYPTVIPTSAASIKGRGMHKLFRKVRSDIQRDKENTCYYYKCDIKKFYESIDQETMKAEIRRHIKDPILLPMLDNFIELMDHGLSIGLRSSQCYGNILLSALDHMLKEKYHVRYYYRYCDDIVVLHGDKRMLWKIRDKIHDKTSEIDLTIKPDEAVRPLSEGLDFLGFVYDGQRARVRKRTKHKFAKKMHEVKSRKRRVQLIGSFYGMAKWGDCRHLMKTILNKKIDMEEFKNLGLVYKPEDGKKRFDGKKYSLGQLVNLQSSYLTLRWTCRQRTACAHWYISSATMARKANTSPQTRCSCSCFAWQRRRVCFHSALLSALRTSARVYAIRLTNSF